MMAGRRATLKTLALTIAKVRADPELYQDARGPRTEQDAIIFGLELARDMILREDVAYPVYVRRPDGSWRLHSQWSTPDEAIETGRLLREQGFIVFVADARPLPRIIAHCPQCGMVTNPAAPGELCQVCYRDARRSGELAPPR